MKVFISWSGNASGQAAEALSEWLPQIIQAVEPFLSSEMDKGARWQTEVSTKLNEARVGIFCLTQENLRAPWILFEAGAVSKTPDARVCTLLLGLKPTDVEYPLAQFQHTEILKEDFWKLLQTVNGALKIGDEKPVAEKTLEKVFERCWPDLQDRLKAIPCGEQTSASLRSVSDLLRELLEPGQGSVRRAANATRRPSPG